LCLLLAAARPSTQLAIEGPPPRAAVAVKSEPQHPDSASRCVSTASGIFLGGCCCADGPQDPVVPITAD
jgi:hypothetical protein